MYIEGRVRVYESMRCTTINCVLVSHAQSIVSLVWTHSITQFLQSEENIP